MSTRTVGASNEVSSFFLIEQFNEAVNTRNNDVMTLEYMVKKVASLALLIIVPLNILLLPFIGIWNCFFASGTVQAPVPPPITLLGREISNAGAAIENINARFSPNYQIRDGKLMQFDALGNNALKDLNSPFEFNIDLNLGEKAEKTRQMIWNRTVPWSHYYKKCPNETIIREFGLAAEATTEQIRAARNAMVDARTQDELNCGPTFSQLFAPEYFAALRHHFPREEVAIVEFEEWVKKFKDVRALPFMNNYPKKFTAMDKIITDNLGLQKVGAPPIVSSTHLLANTRQEATNQLLNYLAQLPVGMSPVKLQEVQQDAAEYSLAKLKQFLGEGATLDDVTIFSKTEFHTKVGYSFCNELDYNLVSQVTETFPTPIEDINELKEQFIATLGNQQARADVLLNKIKEGRYGVVFIQEPGRPLMDGLLVNYHDTTKQTENNIGINSLVHLHKDLWEDYEVTKFDSGDLEYPEKDRKNLIMVVTRCKLTGEYWAFACGHSDANDREDAKTQVTLVKLAFAKLQEQYPDIQLLMEMDSNTDSPPNTGAFREHASKSGYTMSDWVMSCFKQRMKTPMKDKTGDLNKKACDLFLMISEIFKMTHFRVGYEKEQNPQSLLPDIGNGHTSDHFAISVRLKRLKEELEILETQEAEGDEGETSEVEELPLKREPSEGKHIREEKKG